MIKFFVNDEVFQSLYIGQQKLDFSNFRIDFIDSLYKILLNYWCGLQRKFLVWTIN